MDTIATTSNSRILVGVIDTGFNANIPGIDVSKIILGSDCANNDDHSSLPEGFGGDHGSLILRIINTSKTQPLWFSCAVGSGRWVESLVEFVNAAKILGHRNAVVNLSFDLTQLNPDGSITTRYQLTTQEKVAIEYARQHGVLLVVAAGNQNATMSALGQASRVYENIITVGASAGLSRAPYSSYGEGLTLLAEGSGLGGQGTSIAAAKVTSAIAEIWAVNPALSHLQMVQILKASAIDLGAPGWDVDTGFGLLNIPNAVRLAMATIPNPTDLSIGIALSEPKASDHEDCHLIALERPAGIFDDIGDFLDDVASGIKDGVATIGGVLIDAATFPFKTIGDAIKFVTDKTGDGAKAVFNAVGLDFAGDTLNFLYDRFGEKIQGALERAAQYIEKLPTRIERTANDLFSDQIWNNFGRWFGQNVVNIAELYGIPEIAETFADIYKFNSRALNDRERDLAKSVFGDSINLDLVRIDEYSLGNLVNGNRPFTTFNTINTWGPLDDATLIHELTHVWQYGKVGAIYIADTLDVQGDPGISGKYPPGIQEAGSTGYRYGGYEELERRINNGERLSSFNLEQQARIVEDYFTLISDNSGKPDDTLANDKFRPIYAYFVQDVSTRSLSDLTTAGYALSLGAGGDDTLVGGNAKDTIFGRAGNDSIDGGLGDDRMYGGLGNDTFVVDSPNDEVIEFPDQGTDTVNAYVKYTLGNNLENLVQLGNASIEAIGNNLANRIVGNISSNLLIGLAGNDTLIGEGGSDTLDGGEGADEMSGGSGDDTYEVDNPNDVVIEPADSGNDTVNSTVSYGLGDNLENLNLKGSQPINGTGNGLNNAITGNDSGNTLNGLAGNDTLNGFGGNDTLLGGEGNDNLMGGNDDDQLDGGNGDDVLAGEAGNDRLLGGEGSDQLTGGTGQDDLQAGTGNDTLQGDAGDDILAGDAGDDQLLGGEDNDQLNGGLGQDLLRGDVGNDLIDGGGDTDTVSYETSPNGVIVNIDETASYQNAGGAPRLTVFRNTPIPTSFEPNFAIAAGAAQDGFGTTDTLRNLENVIGSQQDDVLIGNNLVNLIQGLGGNDLLIGNAGADTLDGGAGSDGVSYRRDASPVNLDLSTGTAIDSFGNTDTLISIENITGSAGNDTLVGSADANIIFAGAGNDKVSGRAGDDILFGEAGKDTLQGEADNDFLVGGSDADVLDGGEGIDTASYFDSPTRVVVNLTTGAGRFGDAEGDQLSAIENLEGSEFDDQLTGNSLGNIISGLGGNDLIYAEAGNDSLYGDAGNDRMYGGIGDDQLDGGAGVDLLYGGTGNDLGSGGDGDDQLYGEVGNDNLNGDAGDDLIDGGDGDDLAAGGIGNDRLYGQCGNDTLNGDDDNDLLDGGEGDDLLNGGTGNDQLYGQSGNDTLNGDAGNDQIYGGTGSDIANGGDGDDYIEAGKDRDTVMGGAGNDQIYGQQDDDLLSGDSGDDFIDGGEGSDVINGDDGNDRLFGRNGGDVINGGAGGDLAEGGDGDDLLYGQEGSDRLLGQNGKDQIDGGEGDDQIEGGNDDDLLYGQAGLDLLDGGKGNDVLFGGNDNDSLLGQEGNDNLYGETGDDSLSGGNGNDLLSGGDGNDSLGGGAGDDLLKGGTGNDQLLGDAGNDQLYGEEGNDLLNGGDGNDLMVGGIGQDTLTGSHGHDALYGEADDDQLDGGDGNDQLWGDIGNDLLLGQKGDDLLVGGDGNDTLVGGAGNNTLRGNAGNDILYAGNSDTGLVVAKTDKNLLDGGIGLNQLYGDNSRDGFTLVRDGVQTIFNYQDNFDYLLLEGDITFDQLKISQGVGAEANNTVISLGQEPGTVLATLVGVQAQTINRFDFIKA